MLINDRLISVNIYELVAYKIDLKTINALK